MAVVTVALRAVGPGHAVSGGEASVGGVGDGAPVGGICLEAWPLVAPPAAPPTADPRRVEMTATARAPGARGTMVLRMGASPYGVAVEPDGSYRLRVEVAVEGLRSRDGVHHVVWAATPELDRHVRLGTLGSDGRVAGVLAWNKFLVFVTAEASAEPESWSPEILLSALSPSGRMHTMAGHGPFSGEPCLDPRS